MSEKMMKRTDYCGALRMKDQGREVVLCGWVDTNRDHGGLIFIDLRDREGIIQVVIDPSVVSPEAFALAEAARSEHVLNIRGTVRPRAKEAVNPNRVTGDIEVLAKEIISLNKSKTPPFYIQDGVDCDENIRLRYRYLDLRRPEMQEALRLRHKVTIAIRKFLDV